MNAQSHDQIGYCDFTWSPATGCLHGCPYCYGRRITERFPKNWPYGFEPTFWPGRLMDPVYRKKPARIFCGDMADIMGRWRWRSTENPDHRLLGRTVVERILAVVRQCPQHTFLFLTKNPADYADYEWPDNVELGTTITNQKDADERIPLLLKSKAKVKWLSAEPLQGPLNLDRWFLHIGHGLVGGGCLEFECAPGCHSGKIKWLAIGALNGAGVPRTDPELIYSLMRQCRTYRVRYWLKSLEIEGKHIKKFDELASIVHSFDFRQLPGPEGTRCFS